MLTNKINNEIMFSVISVALVICMLLIAGGSITKLSILSLLAILAVLLCCTLMFGEHYAYYALIPLVPFSQSVPIFSIGARSINLGMDTIYIAILILWHVFTCKNKINLFDRSNRIELILMCWLSWNFITILISLTYLTFNQVLENYIVLLRWGQYVPIFIILANGKFNYYQSKKAIIIFCISGVLASGLGFYQIYEGLNPLYFKGAPSFTVPLFREPDPSELVDEYGFYMGSANYNVVGAYLVIAIMLSFTYVFSSNNKMAKLFGLIAIIFMIGGVVITFSRSSFIALIVALLFFMYKHSKKYFMRSVVIVFGLLLFSLIVFQQFPLIADLTETVLNIYDVVPLVLSGDQWSASSEISSQVYGAAARVVGIRDSLYIFLHGPIIGYGFNAYQYYGLSKTPDNYFLQTLAETGIIGFLFLFLFFKEIIKSVASNMIVDTDKFIKFYKIGLSSIVVAMTIVNFTGGIFYIQKVWGAFLIIAGILCSISKESPSISNRRDPIKNI